LDTLLELAKTIESFLQEQKKATEAERPNSLFEK